MTITPADLELRRQEYPKGCRVKLVHMDDPYNRALKPGALGTVICVDDIGTIHVAWDCGSGLGVAYGADVCARVDSEEGKQ